VIERNPDLFDATAKEFTCKVGRKRPNANLEISNAGGRSWYKLLLAFYWKERKAIEPTDKRAEFGPTF
jgi:hypothetical protein